MNKTYGRKFCDIAPVKTQKLGIGQNETNFRNADRAPNLNLIGNKMQTTTQDLHYLKYGYSK